MGLEDDLGPVCQQPRLGVEWDHATTFSSFPRMFILANPTCKGPGHMLPPFRPSSSVSLSELWMVQKNLQP